MLDLQPMAQTGPTPWHRWDGPIQVSMDRASLRPDDFRLNCPSSYASLFVCHLDNNRTSLTISQAIN